MKILLIAGHGNGDPGAVGCGCKEADLTREVVSLVKSQLSKYATVTVFDTNKNAFATINKGGTINFKGYDYVLEVHFNASNGTGHGTEIYVTTAEKDTSVEEKIVANISALGFANRGVKRKNWLVINAAKKQGVSSALLEVCFIDNSSDMTIYKKKKSNLAIAITNGIVSGFGLKTAGSENMTEEEAKNILKSKAGLNDNTIKYLEFYKYGSDLIKKLAEAMT